MRRRVKYQNMNRAPIGTVDPSDNYEYVHCIDMGGGDIGGMNGGVFVVRTKKNVHALYVEKRWVLIIILFSFSDNLLTILADSSKGAGTNGSAKKTA